MYVCITPFSAAVGHRRTEPGGYFLLKTKTTRTHDPIRPTIGGPDPNRPTNGRKRGVYDLGVFVRGGVLSDTAGDNGRQQNSRTTGKRNRLTKKLEQRTLLKVNS